MTIANQITALSLSDLEHLFAEDLSSPIFINLAHKYFEKREYNRAYKVCEIGLKFHPYNVLGMFLLAKIFLCVGKLVQAEKILVELLLYNPSLVNVLRLLVEVQIQLKRDSDLSRKYAKELSKFFPNNDSPDKYTKTHKKPKKESFPINEFFEIDQNMATFAFYEIVKSQKQYQYAKAILTCIENKDGMTPKINEEKKVLNSLIENKHKK